MTAPEPSGAGRLLRSFREDAELTQEKLAENSGVNVRTIREIEAGRSRPRAATVHALAKALELSDANRTALLSADSAGPSVPRQLPPAPRQFTGREHQLSIMDSVLKQRSAPVVLFTGAGGMGKTWLALHWAHANRDTFPDGQLFADLRGFDGSDPARPPDEVMRGFLVALGIATEALPPEPETLMQLYRTTTANRRLLVVLDNARDASQVRTLLPQHHDCLVLVTSRNKLDGLVVANDAKPVPLGDLDAAESRALLERRLGVESLASEPEAVAEIIGRCAGLPLALAIVAARVAMAPDSESGGGGTTDDAVPVGGGTTLADIAVALRNSRTRLTTLSTQDSHTDPRSVFSWSFTALSPDAARLFRSLSPHPGPEVSVSAVASLVGFDRGRARALLAELAAANLVTEPAPGRFGIHELLREYAVELAESAREER